MSTYEKKTWVNNETKVNATNMNHIEEGIYTNSVEIEELKNDKQDVLIPGANIIIEDNTISGVATNYPVLPAEEGGVSESLVTTGEKFFWNNKQDALTFDIMPTLGSNNPVTSSGIKNYVDQGLDKKLNITSVEQTFNASSSNPQSGVAVKQAITPLEVYVVTPEDITLLENHMLNGSYGAGYSRRIRLSQDFADVLKYTFRPLKFLVATINKLIEGPSDNQNEARRAFKFFEDLIMNIKSYYLQKPEDHHIEEASFYSTQRAPYGVLDQYISFEFLFDEEYQEEIPDPIPHTSILTCEMYIRINNNLLYSHLLNLEVTLGEQELVSLFNNGEVKISTNFTREDVIKLDKININMKILEGVDDEGNPEYGVTPIYLYRDLNLNLKEDDFYASFPIDFPFDGITITVQATLFPYSMLTIKRTDIKGIALGASNISLYYSGENIPFTNIPYDNFILEFYGVSWNEALARIHNAWSSYKQIYSPSSIPSEPTTITTAIQFLDFLFTPSSPDNLLGYDSPIPTMLLSQLISLATKAHCVDGFRNSSVGGLAFPSKSAPLYIWQDTNWESTTTTDVKIYTLTKDGISSENLTHNSSEYYKISVRQWEKFIL